jgi:hypothetical protein
MYYPLYMIIMQVYHNSGRMRDFGRIPDFGRKMRLRSEDMTPIVYLDSGDTSRLRLTSRLRSYLMNSVAHHGSNG